MATTKSAAHQRDTDFPVESCVTAVAFFSLENCGAGSCLVMHMRDAFILHNGARILCA